MNLIEAVTRFPDQQSCIDYVESIRFKNGTYRPLCGSTDNVKRKKDGTRVGRWNCHDCKSSFNVLSGTIMERTHIPLHKWLVAITLVVNARKSVSNYQLWKDLEMNQKSAWYMQQRIRTAMASDQAPMLSDVVEADETFVGSKAKKPNKKKSERPNRRGQDTKKITVFGVVERDGNVIAQIAEDLSGKCIQNFVLETNKPDAKILITVENQAYQVVREFMVHGVANHRKEYVNGPFLTNTIEWNWRLLKRAWYESHNKHTVGFTPMYVAKAASKYNNRGNARAWDTFMESVFT